MGLQRFRGCVVSAVVGGGGGYSGCNRLDAGVVFPWFVESGVLGVRRYSGGGWLLREYGRGD